RYVGSITKGPAEIQAEYTAHNFVDGSTDLKLPLAGIVVREAQLDGAPAYPSAMPGGGYVVQVKRRGLHKIMVRFLVNLTEQGAEGELRFKVPEVAQSGLILEMPQEARHVQVIQCLGSHRISESAKSTLLEADLGRVKTIQVRWRR